MNKIELAWAAGFFDGEGCTSISTKGPNTNRPGCKSLHLVVTQCGITAPWLLRRFGKALKYGSLYAPINRGKYLPAYRWQVTGYENVQNAMKRLWPYLGPVKRRQFRKCMKTMRAYKRGINGKTGIQFSR